jgi:hypothetical protein
MNIEREQGQSNQWPFEFLEDPFEFEKTAGYLLSLAGYSVRREQIIGHKKIDLYIEECRLGSLRRIAVECKAHKSRLHQDDVTQIYSNYRPLYQANLIDEVLIVTRVGLSPSSETMVAETRELNHLTLHELLNMIMDFSSYLLSLLHQFDEDGLSKYYIPLRTVTGADLEKQVLEWIISESEQPLAILGSYGMGKTTFTRRMAYVLASLTIADRTARIPIVLRLGDISSEQSLEGLLGKTLTATNVVRNYTFDFFMALNQIGRFVIFLDGFDEMKHTLSWEEFRYNFRQLNRLVVQRSKVVLLGRPTAFLTDEEHLHALHGLRHYKETQIREPGWPDYQEIHLAPFNREQVDAFLDCYLRYRIETAQTTRERREMERVLTTHAKELSSKHFADIARRPVQLRMIAEVLPQWQGDLSDLTLAILYSIFIDLMIEREQDKLSRRHFSAKERRVFAGEVAFWLWDAKSEMNLRAEDIPDHLILGLCRGDESIEAARRDLVSACFLERKIGSALYFPHRSFQEFLVAENIIKKLSTGTISFEKADSIATEQVVSFMHSLLNTNILKSWEHHFDTFRGQLSLRFAGTWASEVRYLPYLLGCVKRADNPWYPLMWVLCFFSHPPAGKKEHLALLLEFYDTLKAKVSSLSVRKMRACPEEEESIDIRYAFICYLCVLATVPTAVSYSRARNWVSDFIQVLCGVGQTTNEGSLDRSKGGARKSIGTEESKNAFFPDRLIIEFMSKISISKKHSRIDLLGTYPFLLTVLRSYCLIKEWVSGTTIHAGNIKLPRTVDVGSEEIVFVSEFHKTYCGRTV